MHMREEVLYLIFLDLYTTHFYYIVRTSTLITDMSLHINLYLYLFILFLFVRF